MTHQLGWESVSTPTDISGTPAVVAAGLSGTARFVGSASFRIATARVGTAQTAAVVAAAAPSAILSGVLFPLLELALEYTCSPPHIVDCHCLQHYFIFLGLHLSSQETP